MRVSDLCIQLAYVLSGESFSTNLLLIICFFSKVQVDPETLIPKLPKPRDLQPFPSTLSVVCALLIAQVYFLVHPLQVCYNYTCYIISGIQGSHWSCEVHCC